MTQPNIICPRLTSVDEVRVFLADDTLSKRDEVFASLGAVGVGPEAFVEVATSFNQANVFLIDGSLVIGGGLHHGSALVGMLFRKYLDPIEEAVNTAKQELGRVLQDRLSSSQTDKLFSSDAPVEVALNSLQSDALFVGTSSEDRGRVRLAQIPRVESLHTVGEVALTTLLGSKGFGKHMGHLEKMKNPHYAAAYVARQAQSTQR